MAPAFATQIPSIGMVATVRQRRGVIAAVEPFDSGPGGRLHLVTVEYLDADGPPEDQLLWEREPGAQLTLPTALPEPTRGPAMPYDQFDALVRATRWTALTPFVDPDGSGAVRSMPICSPLHGAIQVEDFQLVPLLKALRMPRVSLLIADDVGLGKTIEAGLILRELIVRRRLRRVLILCPASLRRQWRDEMAAKFSMSFDIVDRAETYNLRKQLGMDANPWRTFPRVIASYYFLRQPDVLQEFLSVSKPSKDSPHLPWDVLIVDEAHNLAPAAFGEDSDLSEMLGQIATLFEHRIFTTATPHNGHTRCFSGLLERLDPVRFTRTSEFGDAERARVEDVVVRRLKRDINARTKPERFCNREPQELPLQLSKEERALSEAVAAFRARVRSLVAQRSRSERLAGAFAVGVLSKRLLSGPYTFADSWHRYREGLAEAEEADSTEVQAAQRKVEEETGNDSENESRRANATRIVGAWLKPLVRDLVPEMAAVDAALRSLELQDGAGGATGANPARDQRFHALELLIDKLLRNDGRWRDDERLVLFTEFKTTLDYVERRLRARHADAGAIRTLYGGMDDNERDAIKAAFNDPADPVRILVATDAASEGLNLQETARFLLHFDVPWSPARLEQRCGRLDRHGQARDVTAFHFVTNDDADLAFLAHVVKKVDQIRDDLGSTGEVFDQALERHFIHGLTSGEALLALDRSLDAVKGRAAFQADAAIVPQEETGEDEVKRLAALRAEIDLDTESLAATLDVALRHESACPGLGGPDARGRYRIETPFPPRWNELIDEALRLREQAGTRGPVPGLVFDAAYFIQNKQGRPVFRPVRDTALLHLGHPVYQRALTAFARLRYPGATEAPVGRWTVRRGGVPPGADALVLLTIEELGVNELREPFHHWVRAVRLPVKDASLLQECAHEPAANARIASSAPTPDAATISAAREVWDSVASDVQEFVARWSARLTKQLRDGVSTERRQAETNESARFKSRHGELSALIDKGVRGSLERDLKVTQEALDRLRRSNLLFAEQQAAEVDRLLRSQADLEGELKRRTLHLEEMREQLQRERQRVLEHLIPKRFALRGDAQVFPVAIEIRLPAAGGVDG